MNVRYGNLAIMTLACVFAAGCSHAKPMPASYCATVRAMHTRNRTNEIKLDGLIAKFAQREGFVLEGGQQVDTNEYVNRSKKVLLDLTFGMGNFGSVVSLYYVDKPDDQLKRDLDSYMITIVQPVFAVRKCGEIPGFANPQISDQFK
jgi:hypothetical protein